MTSVCSLVIFSWPTRASYFAMDIIKVVIFYINLGLWNGGEVPGGGVGGGEAVFLALEKCTFYLVAQIYAYLPGLRSSLVP